MHVILVDDDPGRRHLTVPAKGTRDDAMYLASVLPSNHKVIV